MKTLKISLIFLILGAIFIGIPAWRAYADCWRPSLLTKIFGGFVALANNHDDFPCEFKTGAVHLTTDPPPDPCPLPATDQCRNYKTGWSWPNNVVGVAYAFDISSVPNYFNAQDTTNWMNAVERAIATWNIVLPQGRLQFVRANPLIQNGCADNHDQVALDAINCVGFKNLPIDTLADTHIKKIPFSFGSIGEVDMVFNIDLHDENLNEFFWGHCSPDCGFTTYDVENVAAHEFGHWLQLNDLNQANETELTMYQPINPRETKKRTLGSGDILGARFLYP